MTKDLVINALNDSYNRVERPSGVILHSLNIAQTTTII